MSEPVTDTDHAEIQAELNKIGTAYMNGTISSDEAGHRAYEILVRHTAARRALEWYSNEVLRDMEAAGVKELRQPI